MRNKVIIWILVLLFAVLMSIPWLAQNAGAFALVGFVPLLVAEELARQLRIRRFWIYHYSAFVLWNAFTTFWVCNATVGGGIFAILANALQMSVIFGIFRCGRKVMKGALPYVFLAVMWIAWERWYLCHAQISWPWLVLGNAFAGTVKLAQWYEFTGTLGGSLWVWICNLSIYSLMASLSDRKFRLLPTLMTVLFVVLPVFVSKSMYGSTEEVSEDSVDVLIAQPDFDPYQKFTSMSQSEQTSFLLAQLQDSMDPATHDLLMVAPETFTSDVKITENGLESSTLDTLRNFISSYDGAGMLVGASSYEIVNQRSRPSEVARPLGNVWVKSHNSAVMLESNGTDPEICHKSKLVVGTELTPYPKVFVPVDEWLSARLGVSGLMGRCEGQDEVSLMHFGGHPFGCAICYESVYGEYCADYVRKGADFMCVITNDAWWGDTPGYRQHFNYSRLRAIELRRDVARCGNTGISAFIDQKGNVLQDTEWWVSDTLRSYVKTSSRQTFFVKHGDITGRVCTLLFLILLLVFIVKGIFFRPCPTGRA